MASIGGNVRVMAKFASHCAMAATPRAAARMRFGNISPSRTQTSGPHDAPKNTTNAFAATRAIGPHGSGRLMLSPLPLACVKASAMMPSESVMPAEPMSRIGRRPTLSTSAIAMNVTATFVTDVIVETRNDWLSSKPTACQSVVE